MFFQKNSLLSFVSLRLLSFFQMSVGYVFFRFIGSGVCLMVYKFLFASFKFFYDITLILAEPTVGLAAAQ